jgi:hypothetical protein
VAPTTNTRHLQGYVYFKNARRFRSVSRILGSVDCKPHLEVAKGSPTENREYCTKDGDFEEFGCPPVRGRRTDLDVIKGKIESGVSEKEIADAHFSRWIVYRRSFERYSELLREPGLRKELKVFAIIGAAGVGKTRYCWEYARSSGRSMHIVDDATLTWFDGYSGQEIALLDDYRGGGRYEFLLRLLDVYPLRVPVKGGFKHWTPTTIFITSNREPDAWHQEDYAPLRRRITKIARISSADNTTWESVSEFLARIIE